MSRSRHLDTLLARSAVLGVLVLLASQAFPAAAHAAPPAPAFALNVTSQPTNFTPGKAAPATFSNYAFPAYEIRATNVGAAPTSGPITITDALPVGITPSAATGPTIMVVTASGQDRLPCSVASQVVTCTISDPVEPTFGVEASIPVDVSATAPSQVSDQVSISGGGAPSSSTSTDTTVSATPPPFGLLTGNAGLGFMATNADGTADTQAGSHPYQLTVETRVASWSPPGTEPGADLRPVEALRDLSLTLPKGVVVNPQATPVRCTEAQLASTTNGQGCPADSQVGVIEVIQTSLGFGALAEPLYNMVPPPGVPAELGFDVVGTLVHIDGGLSGNFALTASGHDLLANISIEGLETELWGDPSDPSHQRHGAGCQQTECPTPVPSTTPFLTMPSACSGPLAMSVAIDSWEHPDNIVSGSAETTDLADNPVGGTGCSGLDFSPSISVRPDSSSADSPTGLSVDLRVPQSDGVDSLAEANLKQAVVQLPAGMSVNPSAADGLGACTPSEIGLGSTSSPTCPDSSKIGSVQVVTPLLPDPLTGGIYLAQQNNNPFGSLLAIYLTAQADGVMIKLPGHVVADPVTGQLTTTFDDNPQLPFSDFKLDFFGGPRATLATPPGCGTYTASSSLSPWSGTPAVSSSDSFQISSGCVSGFSPSFTAGTQNAQAGAYSPFVLSFSRSDTDQDLSGLTVKLPPGMLAKLAGVQECTGAQLAAAAASTGTAELANPSCPSGSQVGTVTTGSGAGPDPFFLGGKAYLTGPYKGAPYGLAVIVPAVAGPYDLGTVVVRQALYIDPTTAQVTAVSDPFPTILQGIPLRIRRIDVSLNRSGFTVNPTSCTPMSVAGTLTATGGLAANMNSRFQVGGCQDLGFSPKLKLALSGKGKTHSGNHPTLTATLTDPSGQANIRSAKVALPLSLALDPNNSQHVCNYATAQAVHGGAVGCPASTIVGQATAVTPLLSQPLSGPVYLVQGIRFGKNGQQIHTLPTLLIPLRGQIALDLRAQSAVSRGKLVTTFATIPDAPVSRFTLKINGGRKGILVITGRGRTICGKPQVANTDFGAQSGKSEGVNSRLGTPACRGYHKPRHKKHKKHKK